jgi:hypothetical protein
MPDYRKLALDLEEIGGFIPYDPWNKRKYYKGQLRQAINIIAKADLKESEKPKPPIDIVKMRKALLDIKFDIVGKLEEKEDAP